MQVRPLSSLTDAEVHDLATHAAERGERVEDANPFPAHAPHHAVFAAAFAQRAADLQPA